MTTIKNRSSKLILIVMSLVILLSSGGVYTVYLTHTIKPDAEIINKLGTIRGSIQRLVKFEISGIENDEIMNIIDSNIDDFQDGKIKVYDKKDEIQYALDNLHTSWIQLKKLIYEYRENPSNENQKILLKESEKVWNEANSMVLMSQIVSERKIDNYQTSFIFFAINFILGIVIIFLIKRYVQDTLEFLVNYDELTKIYNRRYFNEYLDREIVKSQRYHGNLSLIILDIDYFKNVNDTFGHHVGDSILRELSNLIQKNIRKCDVLSRVGGEEFAIVAPETRVDEALVLSENLRKIVEEHDFKYVDEIRISLGMTQFIPGDDADSIYKRADIALYKAKNGGRNRSETEITESCSSYKRLANL